MIVMPANSTGWFWHALARETGRIGHLYSPGGQRGPWPWFPYACDNGAFACWDSRANTFDDERWERTERAWQKLIVWTQCANAKPLWVIVPDVPGNAERTIERWEHYAPSLVGVPRALAVQDGMRPGDVAALSIKPDVIAIGGSDAFKEQTTEIWARNFTRVHLLRCGAPEMLPWLESIGIESTDGTGWARGTRSQTAGLERWARSRAGSPATSEMAAYTCREKKRNSKTKQESFA